MTAEQPDPLLNETAETLNSDLATISAMLVRWHADVELRNSRHNAMFHLEKARYRLGDYLAEVDKSPGL